MKRGDGLLGVPDSVVATSMTRMENKKGESSGIGGSWFSANSAAGGGGGDAVPLLREQTALLGMAVNYLKVIAENSSRK